MDATMQQNSLVIQNIGQLISMQPLRDGDWPKSMIEKHLGSLNQAWLAIENGQVTGLGCGKAPAADQSVDAAGALILPGLVDVHTHPLFAGDRAHEFVRRSHGDSYQDIAAAGGGIRATLLASRTASDEMLQQQTLSRLRQMLARGVTAVEVKSGYGLSVAEELRHLHIYQHVQSQIPLALSVTALALHALPPEEKDQNIFVNKMQKDFLPALAKLQAAGDVVVDSVDAFIEEGYFTLSEGERFFKAAQALGFDLRVHADEFSHSGGAGLAAKLGAASADHLQFASRADAEAMAASQTVAVLLPGTSLYTKLPFTQGRMFLEAGCRVAVATDFNPGSCALRNLPQMLSLAAIHSGLTAEEALVGGTIAAAASIKRFQNKGYLAVGADADFNIFPFSNWQQFMADFGQTQPLQTFIAGRQVFSSVY